MSAVEIDQHIDRWIDLEKSLDDADNCWCHILNPNGPYGKARYVCGAPRTFKHQPLWILKGATQCGCGNAICPDCLLIDRDLP